MSQHPSFPPEYFAMLSDCMAFEISECNALFTRLVFANLQKTGKQFRELTVEEAIELIRASSEEFNARFR